MRLLKISIKVLHVLKSSRSYVRFLSETFCCPVKVQFHFSLPIVNTLC